MEKNYFTEKCPNKTTFTMYLDDINALETQLNETKAKLNALLLSQSEASNLKDEITKLEKAIIYTKDSKINFTYIQPNVEISYTLYSVFQKIQMETKIQKPNLSEEDLFSLTFLNFKIEATETLKECASKCLIDEKLLPQAMSEIKYYPFLDKIYLFLTLQIMMIFANFTTPQNGK